MLLGVFIFVLVCLAGLMYCPGYFKTPGLIYYKRELASLCLPIFILFFQLYFSLNILYRLGELDIVPELTVKIIGNQWYWRYEIADLEGLQFDSFMLLEKDLIVGDPRLLAVDNRLVLPVGVNIRLCITRADVIHS